MIKLSPIITIDGPAGVGKTTVARMAADNLSIPYLDTGAMYRCAALELGEDGLNLPDAELRAASQALEFSLKGAGAGSMLLCGGSAPGGAIRTEAVAALASRLAARAPLREALAEAQRKIGSSGPLVAEGRDMGTVIFPDAAFKFFLTATPEARAERRWREFPDSGESLEEICLKIRERDARDAQRAVSPLKPAPGAIIIDTGSRDACQVLAEIMAHVSARGGIRAFV